MKDICFLFTLEAIYFFFEITEDTLPNLPKEFHYFNHTLAVRNKDSKELTLIDIALDIFVYTCFLKKKEGGTLEKSSDGT